MNISAALGLDPEQKMGASTKIIIGAILLVVALSSGAGAQDSPGEQALSADCTHEVQDGDTLSSIARGKGYESWEQLHESSPWIANPHVIFPGQLIDICGDGIQVETSSSYATQEWSKSSRMQGACASVNDEQNRRDMATALINAMPTGQAKADVVNLVSAMGVESLWGCNIWNPNDAGNGYIGSIGMLQIRTLPSGHADAREGQFDSFRAHNRILGTCDFAQIQQVPTSCLGDLNAQADGIWTIKTTFGFNEGSWGAVPHITSEDRALAQGSVDFVWNAINNPQTQGE